MEAAQGKDRLEVSRRMAREVIAGAFDGNAPDFALRKGGPASMPIDDETSEHDIVSSGDLGDLDIPDFLR